MAKKKVTLSVLCASALLQLRDEDGNLLIPYEHAKLMSADQIISLYHGDHYPVREADGGPTEPWNIVPRLIAAHREKTAKIDQPQMAKSRRLRETEAKVPKAGEPKIDTSDIPETPAEWFKRAKMVRRFPKGRKIESRPFQKRRKGRQS